jgi:hypothetical protein
MGTEDSRRGNRNRCKPHHPKPLIEAARVLWDVHGLTASEIAPRVGLSRAAVCAIADRNDFAARPSPIKRRA